MHKFGKISSFFFFEKSLPWSQIQLLSHYTLNTLENISILHFSVAVMIKGHKSIKKIWLFLKILYFILMYTYNRSKS